MTMATVPRWTAIERFLMQTRKMGHLVSHTTMAGRKGAWFVMPRGPYEAFMDLYAAQVDAGVEMYVVERPTDVVPILVDLDFRFEEGSGLARRYNKSHVHLIVDAYMQCARELFVFDEVEVYVMEKTAPRMGTAGEVKDGLHIVVPGIVSCPKVMRLLRRDVLGRLDRVLRKLGISNSVEDCVDEAVITKNGWLMYGSCKGPGQEPYLVTGVYRWTGELELLGGVEPCTRGAGELAKLLSIRLPEFVTRLHAGVEERAEQAFPPSEPRLESAVLAVVKGTQAWSADVAYARELTGLLSVARADAYKGWRGVGLVLHGLDAGLLDAWVEFSRKSQNKFSQEGCELEWARMRPAEEVRSPLRIGSLVKWAKEDDPEGFERVLRSSGRYNEYEVAVEKLIGLKARIGDEGLKVTGGERGVAQFDSDKVGAGSIDLGSFLVNDRRSVYPPDGFRTQLHSSSGELDRIPVVFARESTDSVRFETTEEDPNQRTSIVAKLNPGTCTVQSLGIKRPQKGVKNLVDRVLMNSVASVMFAGIQQYLADMKIPNTVTRHLRQEHVLYGNPQLFKIEGDNTTVVVNNNYDEGGRHRHKPDMDIAEELKAAGVLDGIVMLPDGRFYCFDPRGWWSKRMAAFIATNIRLAVKTDACSSMDEADVDYVRSNVGAMNVFAAISGTFMDEDFIKKLDIPVAGCLPFRNGMYDSASEELRPLTCEDRVSITTGYDIIPRGEIPSDAFEKVDRFYSEIFPVPEERSIFLKVIGNALFGVGDAKHFLVLSDVRGGYNGKTALMKVVEAVFGDFAASRNSQLLMANTAGGKDADSHSAGMMAYESRRLAVVDEIPTHGVFDVAKLKLLSGCGTFGGRAAHSANVHSFAWRALIVIAANESSLPAINAGSDDAFQRRMVALKMRAYFVQNLLAIPEREPYTYQQDAAFVDTLITDHGCVSAHLHLLANAYKNYVAQKGELVLPDASLEFGRSIISDSDATFAWVQEYIRDNVEPFLGGILLDKKIKALLWDAYSKTIPMHQHDRVKRRCKGLVKSALEKLGAKLTDTVWREGDRLRAVWVGVRTKASS
jgi:hypothetical protein